MQRLRPRDLYDVVHFFRNQDMIESPKLVFDVLVKKCEFKKIDTPTFADIKMHEKLEELHVQWENMLAHQLPSLSPINEYWSELPAFFDWLYGVRTSEVPGL